MSWIWRLTLAGVLCLTCLHTTVCCGNQPYALQGTRLWKSPHTQDFPSARFAVASPEVIGWKRTAGCATF